MTTAYVLIYDTDHGNREDCNIFYSPIEVFVDDETRQKRIKFIKSNSRYDIGFREEDIDLENSYDFDVPEHLLPYDNEDEDDDFDDAVSYHVVEQEDYDSTNPADYYFYAYETEDPFDYKGTGAKVTAVSVVPAAFYDSQSQMYDQSVSVDFGDLFTEVMECEYEFDGTVEQARAAMLATGARENVDFTALIQSYYVNDING